jgi:hypothetical protein
MSIGLDRFIYVGGVAVAALVKSSVHCGEYWRSLSAYCTKRPIAVLIRHDEVTMAFDIDGGRIELDAFERRYPGQRATFERQALTASSLTRQDGSG